MQLYQISVVNNKINNINHANVSKLHEYYNKFDGKSLIQIFYILKDTTLPTAIRNEKFSLFWCIKLIIIISKKMFLK